MRSEAVAESASLVGQCFAERYQLEARIGGGAAGETYRARHVDDARTVVVKVFHEDVADDAARQHHFELDMSKLASLEHPSMPIVLAFGVHAGRRFVVREWLEGETLEERMARGPISLEAAMTIARQLLATLAAVHGAKLLHRDVHPGNVFLESRKYGGERLKLIDFAPVTAEKRNPSPYHAPEDEAGELLDARSDVFAVGALVSAMLRPAFSETSPTSPGAVAAPEDRSTRQAGDVHAAQGALASAAVVVALSAGPAGAAASAAIPTAAPPSHSEQAAIDSAGERATAESAKASPASPRFEDREQANKVAASADPPTTRRSKASKRNRKARRAEARATNGDRRSGESASAAAREAAAVRDASSPNRESTSAATRTEAAHTPANAIHESASATVQTAAARAPANPIGESAGAPAREAAVHASSGPKRESADAPFHSGSQLGTSQDSDLGLAHVSASERLVSAFETSFAPPALVSTETPPAPTVEPENPLQRWIGRAMAPDRCERFDDAADMLRELVDRLPHELRAAADAAAKSRRAPSSVEASAPSSGGSAGSAQGSRPAGPSAEARAGSKPAAGKRADAGVRGGTGARTHAGAWPEAGARSDTAVATNSAVQASSDAGHGPGARSGAGARTHKAAVGAGAGLAAIAAAALALAKPRRQPRTAPLLAAAPSRPSTASEELPEVDPVALHGPGEPGMSQLTVATALGAFAFAAIVIIVMPGELGRARRPSLAPRAPVAEPVAPPQIETRVEAAKHPEPPSLVPLSAVAPLAPAPVRVSPPKPPAPVAVVRQKPMSEARDPWLDPLPKELQRFRASALSDSPGDKATIEALRAYNRTNPKDARGYLITARFYTNRLWRTDSVSQYAAAIERDPSVRGAPEILPALLECVAEGKAAPAAEALIERVYGTGAVPAIDRALDKVKSQTTAVRLSTLSEKLLAKAQ